MITIDRHFPKRCRRYLRGDLDGAYLGTKSRQPLIINKHPARKTSVDTRRKAQIAELQSSASMF